VRVLRVPVEVAVLVVMVDRFLVLAVEVRMCPGT
jgi:hypothetical protein